MSDIKPTMMLVESSHLNEPTFSMIPATLEAPFVECIYTPNTKQLAVISKTMKDTFHFFPRLDDNGDPIPAKRRVETRSPYKEERKPIQTFYEYYLNSEEDIKAFLKVHAINDSTFDIAPFIIPVAAPAKKK